MVLTPLKLSNFWGRESRENHGTRTRKSRITWTSAKDQHLMELYRLSSADLSLGVAKRLLQNWRSHYPEYPTTANALMKRVRTLKKHETVQVPMAGSIAVTEGEESSLPTISVPGDMENGGPNITSSDVSDTGMPRGDPGPAEDRPVDTQGEPEEDVLDSDPELRELVEKVDQIYCQLLRQGGNLRGRRSTKWRGVRVGAD